MAACGAAAIVFLAVALVASGRARALQDRPPTAAERVSAAAAALAGRWRTWPSGRIFPAVLPYTTDLLTTEDAHRIGIAPGHTCGQALTGVAVAAARRDRCQGAIRASYLDGLRGVVYTAGVLAFPDRSRAAAFARAVSGQGLPSGLRAYGQRGTGSARFTDAARQVMAARQRGPYVIVVVAGYADGRSASATTQPRPAIFAPAGHLADELAAPLVQPVRVRCGQPEWSC